MDSDHKVVNCHSHKWGEQSQKETLLLPHLGLESSVPSGHDLGVALPPRYVGAAFASVETV